MSIVEVYNETVQDLLREDTRGLDLRCVGNMIHIPDITEVCVKSTDDVKAVIEMGEKNRSVAETKMNSTRYTCSCWHPSTCLATFASHYAI